MNREELLCILREMERHWDDQAQAFGRWATTPIESRGPAVRTIPLDGEAVLKARIVHSYIEILEEGR